MAADITLLAVFFGGLISFLSPCVLPLVPPYLTFMAGTTLDQITGETGSDTVVRRRVAIAGAAFVAGFTTVFVLLGATASSLGGVLRAYQDVLAMVAGGAIIVMGLHFLGLFRIGLLYRELRFSAPGAGTVSAGAETGRRGVGPGSAYAMGLAFAFGWTPCIGPVLAAVLSVAARDATVGQGMMLLGVYSLGLGVPFMLAALMVGPFLRFSARFRRHLGAVEKVMGGLLVLTGLA
ncbi:MAG: cytochrome c biogenesis protein CcdA, partial [Pseudomonadota bacterium]